MPIRDYPFTRYQSYDRERVAAVLEPSYLFRPQRGSWGISGIVRFGAGSNYVFFVSFGQTQAEHEFDEAVYDSGIMRWQSQPSQKLTDPAIKKLIDHDHLTNDILLFLRTSTRGPYAFMGFLKYVNHDTDRQQPVNFHWQILDFDPNLDYESLMGLRLQAAPITPASERTDSTAEISVRQSLAEKPPPRKRLGIALATRDFVRTPIDYEVRDRRNRGLGKAGEQLVLEYERECLQKEGRVDLADKVDPVCRTIGDGLGYDIKSFDPRTGDEIHIEVKTTTGPPETPFYMSAFEINYARNCPKKYKLFRVYDYASDKGEVPFFVLDNPFATDRLHLTPISYRVRLMDKASTE